MRSAAAVVPFSFEPSVLLLHASQALYGHTNTLLFVCSMHHCNPGPRTLLPQQQLTKWNSDTSEIPNPYFVSFKVQLSLHGSHASCPHVYTFIYNTHILYILCIYVSILAQFVTSFVALVWRFCAGINAQPHKVGCFARQFRESWRCRVRENQTKTATHTHTLQQTLGKQYYTGEPSRQQQRRYRFGAPEAQPLGPATRRCGLHSLYLQKV